jgi:hypothetical protein
VGFRGTTFLHLVSAKGASHSSLGHRHRRFSHICGRALKARRSSWNDRTFSAAFSGRTISLGRFPRLLMNVAPLALVT